MPTFGSFFAPVLRLCLFVVLLINFGFTTGSVWYVGCKWANLTDISNFVVTTEDAGTPSICCSHCYHNGYEYAAIGNSTCWCGSDRLTNNGAPESSCDSRCMSEVNALPCGGGGSVSLYNTAGPYLLALSLTKGSLTVQTGTMSLFDARIELAGTAAIETGLDSSLNADLQNVNFTWTFNGSHAKTSVQSVANTSAISSLLHSFTHTGLWNIGVTACNAISCRSASTVQQVVEPIPADLQVILRPGQGNIPSCVPEHDHLASNLPVVAVFVDEVAEFQAYLSIGVNLTFDWTFGDDGSRVVLSPYLEKNMSCDSILCLHSDQTHVFTQEGLFTVIVNVSNTLGSVQKTLHVIVMNQGISNLSLSLLDDSFHTTPNASVIFKLDMEMANREEAVLSLDFGDGTVCNQSLRDVNETFISGGVSNPAHMYLTASYGDGCKLMVSFSHRYATAGGYTLAAHIMSNGTVYTATLPEEILVQLPISTVHVDSAGSCALDVPCDFEAFVPSYADNVTYEWTIEFGVNKTILMRESGSSNLSHAFTSEGHYSVEVVARNLVSIVTATKEIRVQKGIAHVDIMCSSCTYHDGPQIIALGGTVTLEAVTESGTHPTFTWDFQDGTTLSDHGQENMATSQIVSAVNHTFATIGGYVVLCSVHNLVSRVSVALGNPITVQEPISGVVAQSLWPTIIHDPSHIAVTLQRGSDVIFHRNDNGENVLLSSSLGSDGTYTVELSLTSVGLHRINITASNNVSETVVEVRHLVQERIGNISVSTFRLPDGKLALVALIDGRSSRDDIVYGWTVGGVTESTASSLFTTTLADITAENVTLTVSNLVDEDTLDFNIPEVTQVNSVVLNHTLYAEVSTPVEFNLTLTSGESILAVEFSLRHDSIEEQNVTVPVKSSNGRVEWSHTFPLTGVYVLWVTMTTTDNRHLETTSVISIQENVGDVVITGPALSKFTWPSTIQTWEIQPTSGSDTLYTWSIQPQHTPSSSSSSSSTLQLAGAHTMAYLPFTSPGIYNLTLVASNQVSSTITHATTTLQEPITSLNLSATTVLHGMATSIHLEVQGGLPIQFEVDFGDGSSQTLNSSAMDITFADSSTQPPTYFFEVTKNYTDLGDYTVQVSVSNGVASTEGTAIARVEERITGLVITTMDSWLVNIISNITAMATVVTGNDVIFTWEFNDLYGPTYVIQSNGSSSTIVHIFGLPGEYQISVSAHNALQADPVVYHYPNTFVVQQVPESLELAALGGGTCAPLETNGVVWMTQQIYFRAMCWGSHITFYFDYGDGMVEHVVGLQEQGYSSYYGIGQHAYTSEGEYTVTVAASNQLLNVTQTLRESFVVEIPPTSLHFDHTLYTFPYGNASQLTVDVDMGSNLYYNWSMGDQSNYLLAASTVSHIYRTAGSYRVTVVAFNKVQSIQAGCQVDVLNFVSFAELTVATRLATTYTDVVFTAETPPDSSKWFRWDMGNNRPMVLTSVSTLTYRYYNPGTYYVSVVAGNEMSNTTSNPIEMILQARIGTLLIQTSAPMLPGQLAVFKAQVYSGSDIQYEWDFGDGSVPTITGYADISHVYNSTGEYFVTVHASNDVSSSSATTNIFILDEPCNAPVLDLVGSQTRTIKFSDPAKVEVEVYISCEATEEAAYRWQLEHASNGSLLSLNPRTVSLSTRTLYIPSRVVPIGTYAVTLEVRMNNTIVYARTSLSLEIVSSSLVAVIEGGTTRTIDTTTPVYLNGGFSFDPDHPADSNLGYNWTCHLIDNPTEPCFDSVSLSNQTAPLPSANQSFAFPSSWLRLDVTKWFVFYLTVSKTDRGSATTSQVIKVDNARTYEVLVDCPLCDGGVVNSNAELTLEALCPTCGGNITMVWELFVVWDGSTTDTSSASRCYQADGSGPVDSGSGVITTGQTSTPHPTTPAASPTTPGTPSPGPTGSSSTSLTHGPGSTPSLVPRTSIGPGPSTVPGPSAGTSSSSTQTDSLSPTSNLSTPPSSASSTSASTSTAQGNSQHPTSSGTSPTQAAAASTSSKSTTSAISESFVEGGASSSWEEAASSSFEEASIFKRSAPRENSSKDSSDEEEKDKPSERSAYSSSSKNSSTSRSAGTSRDASFAEYSEYGEAWSSIAEGGFSSVEEYFSSEGHEEAPTADATTAYATESMLTTSDTSTQSPTPSKTSPTQASHSASPVEDILEAISSSVAEGFFSESSFAEYPEGDSSVAEVPNPSTRPPTPSSPGETTSPMSSTAQSTPSSTGVSSTTPHGGTITPQSGSPGSSSTTPSAGDGGETVEESIAEEDGGANGFLSSIFEEDFGHYGEASSLIGQSTYDDDGDTGSSENEGDPISNPDNTQQFEEHIVSKSRQAVVISEDSTLTGLKGRQLILKDGVLEEGRTYAVAVKIYEEEGSMRQRGEAYQYVTVNQSPKLGVCSIIPDRGTELETIFTTTCHSWQDADTPYHYEIRYSLNHSEPETILYYGMDNTVNFLLPAGHAENSYSVYLKLAIVDNKGGKTSVCDIAIPVAPKTFGNVEEKLEYLEETTVGTDSQLGVYVAHGDQRNIHNHVRLVAHLLNELADDHGEELEHCHNIAERCEIRSALLDAVQALSIRDDYEILQAVGAIVEATSEPGELSKPCQRKTSDLLKQLATSSASCQWEEPSLTQNALDEMVTVASNMFESFHHNHTDDPLTVDDRREFTEAVVRALNNMLQVYLGHITTASDSLTLHSPALSIQGSRLGSLNGASFSAGGATFDLPEDMDVLLGVTQGGRQWAKYQWNYPCYDAHVAVYAENPYVWGHDSHSHTVTTAVTSLDLYSCNDLEVTRVNVTDLPTGQEITIGIDNISGELPLHNFTFDPAYMSVHQFNVSEVSIGRSIHISIQLTPVQRPIPLNVLLRYGLEPTPTRFDLSWSHDDDINSINIFLPPDSFNASGRYYLALMDAEFGETVYRQDVDQTRRYVLNMWWAECLYWDQQTDSWSPEGCVTSSASTFATSQCLCTHLTSFGVSFLPVLTGLTFINMQIFVAPNENPVTYTFVGALIGVYILLFIYCYYADRHDDKKQGLIYLKDNHHGDQQYYDITVETGFRTGAGTTARVSIVLHGDEGHSETKELTCDDRPIFERNSRDRFIVSVPESLGNIQRIQLWHNNAGHSPSWYLSRISVRDLLTGEKWFFICERWFAVEEEDGKIERELEIVEDGVGFTKAFFAKGAQYFADYYIWSSVFTRPPYSVFTRVQRLTCCMCISMGFMCINTLWYQQLDKEESDLGVIDVSGEAVLVGIVTALLAIPINFPLIMLFRRVKPLRMPGEIGDLYNYIKSPNKQTDPEEQTAAQLYNLQQWAREKWKHRHKSSIFKHLSENGSGRSSIDADSFSSGFGDLNTEDQFRAIFTDSGLSSPAFTSSLESFDPKPKPVRSMDHKKLKSPKIWLPHCFLFLAWGWAILVITVSAVVTIVLGLKFSSSQAIYWMQSLYFSFLQCIFITQPGVMAMFTICKAWKHSHNIQIFDHYDDNTDLIDKKMLRRSRLQLYEQDLSKAIAARQRSRYLRFARPPQPKELQKAKEKMLKKKHMYAVLWDVTLFLILLFCLLWMAYGTETPYHYPLNRSVSQALLQTDRPFTNISTMDDLWDWLQHDMIDALYWQRWYNGEPIQEGMGSPMITGETVLLGKPSLRQVRVRPHSCPIPSPMDTLMGACQGTYGEGTRTGEPYGPGGQWAYRSAQQLMRYCKWGMFYKYGGDGYTVDLNSTRHEAEDQLWYLRNNSWIDDKTRAVILEFTLYNAPYNLFSAVSFIAEMPGSGGVYPLPKIESVQLYRYEKPFDYFIMSCELLFILLVAVSAKGEVVKAVKQKKQYFHCAWSWVEMSFNLVSVTYFAMYVYRFAYVTEAGRRLKATYLEEFVDLSFLAWWDQRLRDLIGMIIFIVTLKFLHLLRFNRLFAMFSAVFEEALGNILLHLLYYVVIETAYSCLGNQLFGSHYYPFKDVYLGYEVISALIVGSAPDHTELGMLYPVLWPMFYVSYVICMVMLMAGLIKGVLCHSYRKVKKQRPLQTVSGGEVLRFFWHQFLCWLGIRDETLDDDDRDKLPMEFTMAEIQYQVDELVFRMNAILHQNGLPDKPLDYLDDSDATQNYVDDGISSYPSEEQDFENERFNERIQRLEEQLYDHHPELRDLMTSPEGETGRHKHLRAQLELEIFRQLQLSRQRGSDNSEDDDDVASCQTDSGQLSASETLPSMEDFNSAPSCPDLKEVAEETWCQPAAAVRQEDGQVAFPRPMRNLGTLNDMKTSDPDRNASTGHTRAPGGDDAPQGEQGVQEPRRHRSKSSKKRSRLPHLPRPHTAAVFPIRDDARLSEGEESNQVMRVRSSIKHKDSNTSTMSSSTTSSRRLSSDCSKNSSIGGSNGSGGHGDVSDERMRGGRGHRFDPFTKQGWMDGDLSGSQTSSRSGSQSPHHTQHRPGQPSRTNSQDSTKAMSTRVEVLRGGHHHHHDRSSRKHSNRPSPEELVMDQPSEDFHPLTLSMESFPLPNALESDSSDDISKRDEQQEGGRSKKRGRGPVGGSSHSSRLRKTKSRGKGKGRSRLQDLGHTNDGYSSDSQGEGEEEEDIPVIQMSNPRIIQMSHPNVTERR